MPTSTICIDASVVVRYVLNPDDEVIWSLWEMWTNGDFRLIAPSLIHFEVTNGIYRWHRHGYTPEEVAELALVAARNLPIELVGDASLTTAAFRQARRFSLPASYDAFYLAAAEMNNAELWTLDKRLVNTVSTQVDWVKLASPE